MLYGVQTRQEAWDSLEKPWDLIVVGGGITGAGILREAARLGLKVLLLEQRDFAWGTSSRSSKMVHGGLRYLSNMQIGLTWQAVHEREALLNEGVGLVEPLPFLYPTYDTDRMPSWLVEIGLYMYGWMGGKWRIHEVYDPYEAQMMSPGLSGEHLNGAFRFYDAQTDDARLVLRVIREAVQSGQAVALNYVRVEGLLSDESGQVQGVIVRDRETNRVGTARAAVVINATGAWADRLRGKVGAQACIRPLRGSHLIFRQDHLPLYQAVSFPHPDNGRPVFAFPWEGITLVGTTDLDHQQDLDEEPTISPEEIAYLLRAVQSRFPALALTEGDVLATFAGVRPVVSSGEDIEPSKESREHAIWYDRGLLTVTGGKLTTFRHIALDALKALHKHLPHLGKIDDNLPALDRVPPVEEPLPDLSCQETLRLVARYGSDILRFAEERPPAERRRIGGLPAHWLELRWAARHEAVLHLDDLLLRRVRIGLLLPGGGIRHLSRVRALVQEELGWDDARWEQEEADYLARWRAHYGAPADLRSVEEATVAI